MGRICPILNHPLIDGVLVKDETLVNFIQKRNLDFLPNEFVCRSCKLEVAKLYSKKRKKAIELHKLRSKNGSISSLKSSKTSSSVSTTFQTSLSIRESLQCLKNANHGFDASIARKATTDTPSFTSSSLSANQIIPDITKSNADNDVIRRLSQDPTTSNAVKTNKRGILPIDYDDDEYISLNAFNGTRLPNIQPVLPKRKPILDHQNTLVQDIMDEYIKDVTGG